MSLSIDSKRISCALESSYFLSDCFYRSVVEYMCLNPSKVRRFLTTVILSSIVLDQTPKYLLDETNLNNFNKLLNFAYYVRCDIPKRLLKLHRETLVNPFHFGGF